MHADELEIGTKVFDCENIEIFEVVMLEDKKVFVGEDSGDVEGFISECEVISIKK